ncbi:MAG: aspartate aminotransferase family protein [Chloroflexi bacterium]|nr:aspartate aminotransferase family protein [Chloroflexota bacterium]
MTVEPSPQLALQEGTNEYWLQLDQEYRLQTRYTAPTVLDRGEGVRLWDVEGNEWIDFESGQVCVSTGHCHPRLVEAIAEQSRRLMQTGSCFTDVPQILLAKKLAELTPGALKKSFFACTGNESNEVALRMAKTVTGRHEVAALLKGYHGMSAGAWSLTGFGGYYREHYGPGLPGIVHLPPPYEYRCPFADCRGGCQLKCAKYAEFQLDNSTSGRPAAIFVEVVMSAGGMIVLPPQYLRELRRICDERGALLIVDEAQTGIGRSGRWFGCDHYDVQPDVMLMSKSLGGGVPLSAVTVTSEVATSLEMKGYYQSSSHTGDPLLCAAGLANIEIIETERLVENAAAMGRYLVDGFAAIQRRYPILGDVRGLGLLIGVEVVEEGGERAPSPRRAGIISSYCRDNGLFVGHHARGVVGGNVIRILPPLTLTRAEADAALAIFERGVALAFED